MSNTQHTTPKQKTNSSNTTPVKDALKRHAPVLIAGLVLVLGCTYFGYVMGKRQGLTVVGFDMDAKQLNNIVQQQKAELEVIGQRFNATVQERDVAVSNANKFYQAYNDEKANTVQVEGINKMYRELLKARGGVELTVQNISINSLPDNAYEYAIDLVQVSPNGRKVAGNVELRLINGEKVMGVPLEDRTFSFEHYERLTGRWTMPKGFTPQYVEVHLTGATPVIKRFAWQRGKDQGATSKSISEIPQAKANSK